MIKQLLPFTILCFIGFWANAQDAKSPAKDRNEAKLEIIRKGEVKKSKDPKKGPQFNEEALARMQSNLKEDGFGNLINPVVLVPYSLNNPDQKGLFLKLKQLREEQNPTSTYISHPDTKENIAFVINSKEAFTKWADSKPLELLAYVYEGMDALKNAPQSFTRKMVEQGLMKYVDMQLVKRTAKSTVPQNVPQPTDKLETLSN